MKISSLGLELIKHYEGLHDGDLTKIGLQPKLCPAGIWTVGWGHALRGSDGEYLRGAKGKDEAYSKYPNMTIEQADELLLQDTTAYGIRVDSLRLNLAQTEFDALLSFSFNVGFSNLKSSTLLKYILTNSTNDNIRYGFRMWNKATNPETGKKEPLKGLSLRRESEAELFINGILNFKP